MKENQTNDLLLLAAAGVGIWYFFLRPKQPVPGAPSYNGYVPANAVTPTGTVSTTNAVNALLAAGQKLLNPAKAASNTVSTQATTNSAAVQNEVTSLFSTPSLSTINTGFPQSYIPPALDNNTIFNSQPSTLLAATVPDNTSNTPPVYEAYDDSLYKMFQNGDYPGANISGCSAARIGEY